MQGCIKTATQSRCTMQRHKWLSLHRCNGTNGCRCTDATAQMAVDAQMQRPQRPQTQGCVIVLAQSFRHGCETNRASTTCKDARWRSHRVVMQGCIKTAAQSRYARMHKDSHTKPLHDATAQMAVDAQMQRHKWLSMPRCNGTNGCRCTDVATQTADEARMLTSNNLYNF